ncbi:MAG: XdhC family protein [Eubacteriales bacterium]|nr:XdhC family protein [Eubacteriales bacterium]
MGLFNVIAHIPTNARATLYTALSPGETPEHMLLIDGKKRFVSGAQFHELDLTTVRSWPLGMHEMNGRTYFADPLAKESRLVICGGGYVGQALTRIAKIIGFRVIALEDRLSFARAMRVAGADEVKYNGFSDALAEIDGDASTFFVILTRGHRYDLDCLRSILKKDYAYLGMISSKYRAATARKTMLGEGFPKEQLAAIHSPIGLWIGSQTPEEIGVAIAAELIQVKNSVHRRVGFTQEMIEAILNTKCRMALATIVRRQGSSPRDIGTKMLIREDGTTVGTIGGGCAEADIRTWATDVIHTGKSRMMTVDMRGSKITEEEGMICGGVIDVFIEPVQP